MICIGPFCNGETCLFSSQYIEFCYIGFTRSYTIMLCKNFTCVSIVSTGLMQISLPWWRSSVRALQYFNFMCTIMHIWIQYPSNKSIWCAQRNRMSSNVMDYAAMLTLIFPLFPVSELIVDGRSYCIFSCCFTSGIYEVMKTDHPLHRFLYVILILRK